MLSSPRAGSTYVLGHLAAANSCEYLGEVFNEEHSPDKNDIHSYVNQPNIAIKIQGKQYKELEHLQDILFTSPNYKKYFLYRVDFVDQVLSYILASYDDNWQYHGGENLYSKTIDWDEQQLSVCIESVVENILAQWEGYKRYDWDGVFALEDFPKNNNSSFLPQKMYSKSRKAARIASLSLLEEMVIDAYTKHSLKDCKCILDLKGLDII